MQGLFNKISSFFRFSLTPKLIENEKEDIDLPFEKEKDFFEGLDKSWCIYILLCADEKYYVGKTKKNIMQRFEEHLSGEGSLWTKKYKPIKILHSHYSDKFEEDKITKMMISAYGIDNVRGGSYCQLVLSNNDIAGIYKELNCADDRCFKCGERGHFSKVCPSKSDPFKEVFIHHPKINVPSDLKCTRCGRNTHTIEYCYAKKHLNGRLL